MEALNLYVSAPEELDLQELLTGGRDHKGANPQDFTDPNDDGATFVTGRPYKFAPLAIDPATGGVKYKYKLTKSPDGWYINEDNGDVYVEWVLSLALAQASASVI